MRHILLTVLCCVITNYTVSANNTTEDSLLLYLSLEKQPQKRADIYRNLADLYFDKVPERKYLKLMYQEAKKAHNDAQSLEALGDLTYTYARDNKIDSAHHYLNTIKNLDDNNDSKSWITYLNMRLFDKEILQPNNTKTIIEKLEKHKNTNKDNYSRIEYAYVVSRALFANEEYQKALPYAVTAVDLANTLPFKEGFKIQTLAMHLLSRIYMQQQNNKKGISAMEEIIKLQIKHYEQYKKQERPFFNINTFLIQNYTTLLISSIQTAPQKVYDYMRIITSISEKLTSDTDKYSKFLAMNNYYLFLEEWEKAITTNDSLIKYAYRIAPENVPGLYDISSQIYAAMGLYEEALKTLQKSRTMQDSISAFNSQEQLNELQVAYNVDKLNYEKSQLEIKNKRIILICLSAVLLIAIGLCVYLYKNLKKERAMKTRLRFLKTKAEESEKMKTAFINSICHEIRTPLNAIVGFTGILFDENIDEELRQTFPDEVQRNSSLLTSLINSMLEVSNLDVSDEQLPCEPTNINNICNQEMKQIKKEAKPCISYHLDIPEEAVIIPCHEHYLSIVVENVLNNANKFTEKGDITLHFHVDKKEGKLIITIKDTGCGIPPEKRNEVFERFTKLDTYKPGSGLGLYLCKLIVSRLSGEIIIDNEYTSGTLIVISLPVNLSTNFN